MPSKYFVRRAYAVSPNMDDPVAVDKPDYKDLPLVSLLPEHPSHNLITSMVLDQTPNSHSFKYAGNEILHAPTIDIDHPCTVVPSAQPGHYHLFIDKEMSQSQYWKLLDVMTEVGLVEPGYLAAAKKNSFTGVRIPGKNVKPGLPDTWVTRVKEHAKAVWDKFRYEAVLREIANIDPKRPKLDVSPHTLNILAEFTGPARIQQIDDLMKAEEEIATLSFDDLKDVVWEDILEVPEQSDGF